MMMQNKVTSPNRDLKVPVCYRLEDASFVLFQEHWQSEKEENI